MAEEPGRDADLKASASRLRPTSSRPELTGNVAEGRGSNERVPRRGQQSLQSRSAEHSETRFLRQQRSQSPQNTSPGLQETTRLLSRDSVEQDSSFFLTPRPSRTFDLNHPTYGVRHRRSSTAPSPSPGPSRSWKVAPESTRRSVAIAATSGRDSDTASRKFSLAGPAPLETLAANQPYVDPGYTQLNPAYDQPANVRPVWGLAKPLPHVLRPGMVPAKDEIKEELLQQRADQDQSDPNFDLESGRIEPTLRPDIIASCLDDIRRDRELNLFEAYRQHHDVSPVFSPFGRTRKGSGATMEAPMLQTRVGDTIMEEDEDSQHMAEPRPAEMDLPHLDQAIANVNRARGEADAEWKAHYQDAVPLLAYEAEDDEIHNLHTYWSVVRLRFREPLAELLAVVIQYTLGFSLNLSLTVSRGAAGAGDTASWAWGLAAMVAIYIAGGISGAHLNPAISIMLYIYRGFPLRKIPIYTLAQFIGALLATWITYGIFRPGLIALHARGGAFLHENEYFYDTSVLRTMPHPSVVLPNFITFPRAPWVDMHTAFVTELTGTAILVVSVLALGDDTNAPPGAGMNAFIIGLVVCLLGMALGYNTGLALNPVRDFGPRVALAALGYGRGPATPSLFADGYWFKVAWLGPLCGAVFGGFLYDAMIFVGGESPVNYPAKRIKRATRKWKTRWQARVARTRRRVKNVKDEVTRLS